MKCGNCGQEVDKKAAVCTACGCKIKKPFYKKWWVWAIAIVIIVAVASPGDTTKSTESQNIQDDNAKKIESQEKPKSNDSEAAKPKKNSPKISKAEFESLKTGMTYEEVVSIIGGEGEISSQSDVAGYNMAIYIWKGEGSLGANANVTFQNNSLVAKAQMGLE